MSRLPTVVSLLVIGLLSCAFADQESSGAERNGFSAAKQSLLKKLDERFSVVKDRCNQKNLSTLSDTLDAGFVTLKNCFETNFNEAEVNDVIMDSMLSGDQTLVPKLVCDKLPNLFKCGDDFSNLVKPCLEPAEISIGESWTNTTKTALDFVCHNNLANVKSFIDNGGIDCLKSKAEAIRSCVTAINFGFNITDDTPLPTAAAVLNRVTLVCRSSPQVEACLINQTGTCSNKTPSNLISSFIAEVKRYSYCQHLPKEGAA